ncbi:hypothetical protein [Amycolatopsis lexingtonensis]|uniref:hypothetical protein n=1 Tax=Amycolatopsis lexingtonensis TaxID=218822 RepID=UPI003F729506
MMFQVEPLHRIIVAVDIEGFGAQERTNTHRLELRRVLWAALRQAFAAADIADDLRYVVDTGDGVVTLIDPVVPKTHLLADVVPSLAAALREYNLEHAGAGRIRLRLAVHAGEVVRDEHGFVGDSLSTTLRLLDSAELGTALQLTDADLAMIVTESFYQNVIAHGARGIDPSHFRHILVKAKGLTFPARIRSADPPSVPPPPPEAPFDSGDLHHVSMLLVDIEDHGTRPDKIKGVLRWALRRMVTAAIAHAGVAPLQAPEAAGDSLRYVFGPGTPKNRLIDPLIPALTRELVAYNRTALPGAHMRLRVVVDSGELFRDEYDFFGSALNDAYGLLNSEVLRDNLRRDPEQPLALMVSHEIYDGVVRHGYGAIDPVDYIPTTVPLKQWDVPAWVHLPCAR